MLISSRKGACVLAAALSLMGGAAHANVHTVTIVDGGYLPVVTYAAEGDAIIFENDSEAAHTVNGAGGTWTSGSIGLQGTFMLEIEEETPLTFSGTGVDGIEFTGEISYDEPPLAD
ncbi:MAG: hypothetical protein ABJL67_03290 [Sulfitobacter sp.]